MIKLSPLWLAFLAFTSLQQNAVLRAESPVTTPSIRQRGLVSQGRVSRLAAVMAKERRGEEICVAAIGGSITAGGLQTKDPKNRYLPRVADWCTQTFPKAKVCFVGYDIDKDTEPFASFSIDGGKERPVENSPNRLTLAEDLPPGQHRVRIDLAGSKVPAGSDANVRIRAVGAAGALE